MGRPAADGSSTPRVLANDFVRQWHEVGDDVTAAMERVGRSGWLILGEEVRAFEEELATWWGAQHAVGVASGLDALEIALRCAGIRPGDRVLTTPLTAFATTLAILRAGAVPAWCDVEESGGLDLERALSLVRSDSTIRGVLPVHLYGHPLDPAGLEALVAAGAILVEDCAQSIGAHRAGLATGLVGVAAATSFYPTKNLGAMGDGGAVITDDPEVAAAAREMRNYGQRRQYEHVRLGLNSRLDELQAAILRTLLPRLRGWTERRREVAQRYTEVLRTTRLRPIATTGGTSAHHLFAVEVVEADPASVAGHLGELGVRVGRHYPCVCPDQPAAEAHGEALDGLETARRMAAMELSLPIHPFLTDDEVQHVIDACQEVAG